MKAENRQALSFQTDKVYTFHIFQHLVDCSTYELDLSVYRFDLTHYLDGQPLQVRAKPSVALPFYPEYLGNLRMLHVLDVRRCTTSVA